MHCFCELLSMMGSKWLKVQQQRLSYCFSKEGRKPLFERLKVSWTLSWTQGLASENIGRVSRATTRLGEREGGLQKRRPAHLYLYVTRSHVPPVGLILPLFSTPFRHLLTNSSLFAQKLQIILRKQDCTRYKRDFPAWDQL